MLVVSTVLIPVSFGFALIFSVILILIVVMLMLFISRMRGESGAIATSVLCVDGRMFAIQRRQCRVIAPCYALARHGTGARRRALLASSS